MDDLSFIDDFRRQMLRLTEALAARQRQLDLRTGSEPDLSRHSSFCFPPSSTAGAASPLALATSADALADDAASAASDREEASAQLSPEPEPPHVRLPGEQPAPHARFRPRHLELPAAAAPPPPAAASKLRRRNTVSDLLHRRLRREPTAGDALTIPINESAEGYGTFDGDALASSPVTPAADVLKVYHDYVAVTPGPEAEAGSLPAAPLRRMTLHELHAKCPPHLASAVFTMEYHSLRGYRWVDIIANPDSPSEDFEEYLSRLADENGFHPATVKDCLTPFHLPKVEKAGKWVVIIARYPNLTPDRRLDPTITNITHKLVLLLSPQKLITIRRVRALDDFPHVVELVRDWDGNLSMAHLVNLFMDDVISAYRAVLTDIAAAFEVQEALLNRNVVNGQVHKSDVKQVTDLYQIRRQVHLHRRLATLTKDVIHQFLRLCKSTDPFQQDLQDQVQSLVYQAESLHEDISALLNLHLALVDHHTNRLLYLLTTFTIFFIPLSFLVGYYGMNFVDMPELRWRYGYQYFICLALSVVLTTFVLLKRKGFI